MTDTLSEAADAAGLCNPDLLKIARTDVPPAEAIAELQAAHPFAFESMAQLAAEFEMIDLSAVTLARPGLPPREAMEVLKREYPAAFRQPDPPFDARTATKAEVDAKWAEMQRADGKRRADAAHERDMAQYAAKYGTKP